MGGRLTIYKPLYSWVPMVSSPSSPPQKIAKTPSLPPTMHGAPSLRSSQYLTNPNCEDVLVGHWFSPPSTILTVIFRDSSGLFVARYTWKPLHIVRPHHLESVSAGNGFEELAQQWNIAGWKVTDVPGLRYTYYKQSMIEPPVLKNIFQANGASSSHI